MKKRIIAGMLAVGFAVLVGCAPSFDLDAYKEEAHYVMADMGKTVQELCAVGISEGEYLIGQMQNGTTPEQAAIVSEGIQGATTEFPGLTEASLEETYKDAVGRYQKFAEMDTGDNSVAEDIREKEKDLYEVLTGVYQTVTHPDTKGDFLQDVTEAAEELTATLGVLEPVIGARVLNIDNDE